jgi:hypothetical protein
MNPRAGLDDVEKSKFLILLKSDPSVVQRVANRHTYCVTPASLHEDVRGV